MGGIRDEAGNEQTQRSGQAAHAGGPCRRLSRVLPKLKKSEVGAVPLKRSAYKRKTTIQPAMTYEKSKKLQT